MKLIHPSFEILPTSIKTLEQDIELVARNCYKSEDKIIPDVSAEILLEKLIHNKHNAMLEFGQQFVFSVGWNALIGEALNHLTIGWLSESLFRPNFINFSLVRDMGETRLLISGSLRAIRDLIICTPHNLITRRVAKALVGIIPTYLFPHEVDYKLERTSSEIMSIKDLKAAEIVGEAELDFLPVEDQLLHRTLTVRIICDRGVSHELVRHRPASFAQESTRYCNYGKDEHIKYIIPNFTSTLKEGTFDDSAGYDYIWNSTEYDVESINCDNKDGLWMAVMNKAEQNYNDLINLGWKPQQARSVLPNSLKTEIIIKATMKEWNHIFYQRCASGAHPQMKEIMIPLKKKVIEIFPSLITP